jgi:hypothetical protein
MKEQFKDFCKYCGLKIYPDPCKGYWTTKRMNGQGSYNSCGKPHTKPHHEPLTNLEYLEYLSEQKESQRA